MHETPPHIDALTQASIGMRLPALWYVHVLCGMCNVQCLTYGYPAIVCSPSLLYISCTYTHTITTAFPTNNAATVSSIVEKGSDILLVCNITGAGLEYRWSFNGNAVKESGRRVLQNESLVIMRAQFSDAGSYVCTASNLAGSASQQHNLTVFGE